MKLLKMILIGAVGALPQFMYRYQNDNDSSSTKRFHTVGATIGGIRHYFNTERIKANAYQRRIAETLQEYFDARDRFDK